MNAVKCIPHRYIRSIVRYRDSCSTIHRDDPAVMPQAEELGFTDAGLHADGYIYIIQCEGVVVSLG